MKQISVIVPVYNVEEHFLKKCINSILNQTYANLQVILVNDGATDGSGIICEKFARQDGRILVKNKVNGGISSARNAGLDLATGEFIMFVDCDDYLNHEMINSLFSTAMRFDVDIVQCDHYLVDESFSILNDYDSLQEKDIIDQNTAFEKFVKGQVLSSLVWDKIYKKKIFSKLRFPDGQFQEDAFILSNIYSEVETNIVVDGSKYYYYVQRQNSKFHQKYDLNFMISSFKSYENRMKIASLSNKPEIFKIAANQLGSDLLQYYNLIEIDRIVGPKKVFYKEIRTWFKKNRRFMTLNTVKLKLITLNYSPYINHLYTGLNNLIKK